MKYKLILVTFLITNLFFAQEQQESYSFTLDEAIAHALENNYQVLNAERDIQAAIKKKWETTAIGLPQVDANINYQNNF